MIQFNLLPDVKIEFVKAQRTKRLVMGVAIIATITSFTVFLLLFMAVQGVQRKSIGDLDADIKKYSSELKSTPDLDKILTIQNQLAVLDGLHDDKVAASRIFGLMQQVTPADVTIADHTVNFEENTMTITGEAPALDKVNTYTDTLKFATFTRDGEESVKAFSAVVLSQFSRDSTGSTYTITLGFDPALFDINQEVKLVVPKTVTTRSVVGQPLDIFKKGPTTNAEGAR